MGTSGLQLLELQLDGIEFKLCIHDYEKDKEWCKVDLSLRSDDWLNYSFQNKEVLEVSEVQRLYNSLTQLMEDKLLEVEQVEFAEPDISFELYPKYDIRDNPNVVYVSSGLEISDIMANMSIAFWYNGALTANKLVMTLGEEEIGKLIGYLELIIGMA